MKFRLNEAAAGLSNPPGQTALKNLIVTSVEKDLSMVLNSDEYCVHHLNGDHSDYSADNIAITTIDNHDSITGLIRWCNWEKLKTALSDCFVIKLHTQKLTPSEIDKIVNRFKRSRVVYVDTSTGDKWVVSPDLVHKYSATPLDYTRCKHLHEIVFDSDEEFREYIKLHRWKKDK